MPFQRRPPCQKISDEKTKIKNEKQRIDSLLNQVEEDEVDQIKEQQRVDLAWEIEQMRRNYEKKCRAVEELRQLEN